MISLFNSNHDRGPDAHVIRLLERHGIPYYYLPTTMGKKREVEILDLVHDTDFLVLARYMQVIKVLGHRILLFSLDYNGYSSGHQLQVICHITCFLLFVLSGSD